MPHDAIESPRRSVEGGQGPTRPGDCVNRPLRAQAIDLTLIPVRKRVAKLNQPLVGRSVTRPVLRGPAGVRRLKPPVQTRDAQSTEVGLDAASVRVASIDRSTFRRRCDKDRLRSERRLCQDDHPLCAKVVKVPNEGLELRHYPEDVRVSDRSTKLPWTTRSIDLAHASMRRSEHVDGLSTSGQPRRQRERSRVRHTESLWPPLTQSRANADSRVIALRCQTHNDEWAQRDSNPRPMPCKGSALPTELYARRTGSRAYRRPAAGRPGFSGGGR